MRVEYETSLFGSSLKAGLAAVRRCAGLVLLLYAVDLALAFVLAVPLYSALARAVGPTGFGPDLAAGFDLVLWADVMQKAADVFRALGAQLFWMVPLYAVWKTAAGVGLVHALGRGGAGSFWQGVGRHTGRGLLVALGFAPLVAGWLIAVVVLYALVDGVSDDEVVLFWANLVWLPLLAAAGLALLDLMHDYARIALVVDEHPGRPVRRSLRAGLGWPFRHGLALALYALWLVPAALLLVAPSLFDTAFTAGTAGAIWLLFLVQQLCLLLRAATSVGWLGSEVAFFETVRARQAPLLADAPEAAAPEAGTPETGAFASAGVASPAPDRAEPFLPS